MPDARFGLSESEIVVEFVYRPNRIQAVVLFCLATTGTILFTYFAIYLDTPINVKGFELTARQGRVLFGIFAALSPIGLFALLGTVYLAFGTARRVALTRNSMFVPRPTGIGLSSVEIELPFESIHTAEIVPFVGNALNLRLVHQDGVIQLFSNMFENRQTFAQLAKLVQNAVNVARQSADSQS